MEGHCCRYCGGRLSLTDKTSLSLVQAAADEALERRAEKLVWHVRRTWNGGVEVLIKKKGDYSEIDILEGLEDVKRTLSSKFRNLYYNRRPFSFFFHFLNYFLYFFSDLFSFSLTDMKIEVFAAEVTGAALRNNGVTVALASLFVTPLILLALLFIVFLYFGYSYRQ